MTHETKVGLFTLAGAALFAAGILILGDIHLTRQYPLTVYFNSAEGLPDKGPVKVAGVQVGIVEDIVLDGRRAKVTVMLNKGVKVHQDAKAAVASTGLIGSKYMELSLGSESAPLLEPGAEIQGEPSVSIDEMMKKLGEFFRDDGENGNPAENLRATMANLRHITDSLNVALGQQQQELTEIVQNIHSMMAHGKNLAKNVDEIVEGHREDVEVTLAKVRSVSERLDEITAKISRGEGTLGKLLNDDGMGKDMEETVQSIKNAAKDASALLGKVTQIQTYWDYRQRYDFEDDQARADVGLKIVTRPGKFYFVQGNNLGKREDRKDDPDADLERKNTFTAVMGRDFGAVTLYGGVIRSAGGAGLKLRPLGLVGISSGTAKRFELEAEGYDFSRDETIRGHHFKGGVYNVGARVLVWDPFLWLGAGVEDIGERQNVNANVNFTFKDEDISYLLGFVGLAGRR